LTALAEGLGHAAAVLGKSRSRGPCAAAAAQTGGTRLETIPPPKIARPDGFPRTQKSGCSWNTGFSSCAAWLSWRVGLDLGAARESLYQRARARATFNAGAGDVSAETSSVSQQQADALALLAETALHHGLDPGAPGESYQVVVHVDAPVLADPEQPGQSVLEGGTHVPAETSQRLACDASRVVMRHDGDGRVVEIGARTRTIPPALRRALHHRDQGCRFPGCHGRFTEGHHLRHWAHGGPTTLSNLALLCRRHHRAVHEEGYQVARLPDGTLQFRRPNGHPLPEVPPPTAAPGDPVTALRACHDAQGLRVTARTGRATWLGERLNVTWAIDVLHLLAMSARPC
jgi:5-methylcytosine-specific restriction endonuclease McrA